MNRESFTKIASAVSFAALIGIADANEPAAAQQTPDAMNLYLEDLNKRKVIKVKPEDVTPQDRERLQKLRAEFPNVQFVKLGHLPKYVSLSADHVAFDPAQRQITITALNLKNYRDTLTSIYLTPFTSWPSHTVVAFNGFKPGDEDICAFVPNSDVAEARSIRVLREAVGANFRVDWDKAGQTPPSGTREENLATQQTIKLSNTRLPTHLFDARKLTCVVVEMPDSSAMMRLSGAPDGQWISVIRNGQLVRDPVPKAGGDAGPQPTQ